MLLLVLTRTSTVYRPTNPNQPTTSGDPVQCGPHRHTTQQAHALSYLLVLFGLALTIRAAIAPHLDAVEARGYEPKGEPHMTPQPPAAVPYCQIHPCSELGTMFLFQAPDPRIPRLAVTASSYILYGRTRLPFLRFSIPHGMHENLHTGASVMPAPCPWCPPRSRGTKL